MSLQRAARAAFTVLATAAAVSVGAPLAAGVWAPAWLAFPPVPVPPPTSESLLGVPDVPSAFVAEQRDAGGELLWRLRGGRVRSASLQEHALEDVRLEAFQGGRRWAEVTAPRAEVRARTEGEAEEQLRVVLSGGVELHLLELASCRTEALTLSVGPAGEGLPGKRRVELLAPGPVACAGTLPGGGEPWQLEASALRASNDPGQVELLAPARLRAPWRGAELDLQASAGATLEARWSGEDPTPAELRLELRGLTSTASGAWRGQARAGELSFTLARRPLAAGALGGTAGVWPGEVGQLGPARYALLEARARGQVVAEVSSSSAPGLEPGALQASTAVWRPAPGDLDLEGSPARLDLTARELSFSARRLRLGPRGTDGAGVRAEGQVALTAREPAPPGEPPGPRWRASADLFEAVTGTESPWTLDQLARLRLAGSPGAPFACQEVEGEGALRGEALSWTREAELARCRATRLSGVLPARLADGAAWSLASDRLELDLDRQELRGDPRRLGARAWRSAARRAELSGEPASVARAGSDSPRRRLGLAARRLVYQGGAAPRLDGAGDVRLRVGDDELSAPRVGYDLVQGELRATGGLLISLGLPGPETAPPRRLELRAAAGRAELPLDEAPRLETRALRREARRRGLRLVPPPLLRALELEGGPERLRLEGPDGLAAQADRLSYRAEDRAALLEASAGGPPIEARWGEGGQLQARRVAVGLLGLEPTPTWWVALRDEVVLSGDPARVRGRDAAREEGRLTLRAERALAEVAELPGGTLRPGRFGAWGPQGVELSSAPAAGVPPLGARAWRVLGDASRERAALLAPAGDQLELWRGPVRFSAPRASLALEDERRALRVALAEGWSASFPWGGAAEPTQARGGEVELVVDLPAARAAGAADELRAGLVARLVRELDARGGLSVDGPDLAARADTAQLDRAAGVFLLRGDPLLVRRRLRDGWLQVEGREEQLRLD